MAEKAFFADTVPTERGVEPFGARIIEIDDQSDPSVPIGKGPIAHRGK